MLAIGIWALIPTPALSSLRARIGVESVIDLGTFDQSCQKPINAQTMIRNSGTAPLVISRLRLSCNCASARLESEEIPAGGAGKLFLTLRPGSRNGLTSARLTLHSNDPENPVADLIIRWECLLPYGCQPDPIRLLVPKNSGDQWTSSAQIVPQFRALKLPAIKRVSATPGWLNVRFEPATAHENRCVIQLAARDQDVPAEPSGTGLLHVDFQGGHESLAIPVEWRRPDVLVIEPSSTFAGIVRPGEKINKRFWVRFDDGRTFTLVGSAAPEVELALPASWPRTGAVVAAALTAPHTKGTFERSFELATTATKPVRRRVRIHGIVE